MELLASTDDFTPCLSANIGANPDGIRSVQREGDTTHVYSIMQFALESERDAAYKALLNRTVFSSLKRCIENATSIANIRDPPLKCDTAACSSGVANVYAYFATTKAPENWPTQKVAACAIAQQRGRKLPSPSVTQLPDDTPQPPFSDEKLAIQVENVLKGYGDARAWYRLTFCSSANRTSTQVAYTFFSSENNAQAVYQACNGGAAGLSAMALVFNGNVSLFLGDPKGTCPPFDEKQLGYFFSPHSGNDTPFYEELYFILPVSIGGGVLLLCLASVAIYFIVTQCCNRKQD